MILFVGEESTGYFVEEVAKSYQQTIVHWIYWQHG